MDSEYLQKHVGDALSRGLAEVVMKQPSDPIDYLAGWLRKYVENVKHKTKEYDEHKQLEQQREEAVLDARRRKAMQEEQEHFEQQEEELKQQQKAGEEALAAATASAAKPAVDPLVAVAEEGAAPTITLDMPADEVIVQESEYTEKDTDVDKVETDDGVAAPTEADADGAVITDAQDVDGTEQVVDTEVVENGEADEEEALPDDGSIGAPELATEPLTQDVDDTIE